LTVRLLSGRAIEHTGRIAGKLSEVEDRNGWRLGGGLEWQRNPRMIVTVEGMGGAYAWRITAGARITRRLTPRPAP
jgi:hypothetical protein